MYLEKTGVCVGARSGEIKLKSRLTRTFGKLSYFLQCLGGSSYRELTEKNIK